jgi:hypothetical protein
MQPLHRVILGGVMTLMASGATAAELGQRYDSYRDMHKLTQYGTLFFNEGAIRSEESRALKRFIEISGAGDLKLPSQKGYCFVFNHYAGSNNNFTSHTYQGKISKRFEDGRQTEEVVGSTFTPATHDWSSNLPDFCITSEGLRESRSRSALTPALTSIGTSRSLLSEKATSVTLYILRNYANDGDSAFN